MQQDRRPPAVIVPGLGGSGPDHWQTAWQAALPRALRFAPRSWDRPDPADWRRALLEAVAAFASPPVLVAHSLGCLVAAEVARREPAAVAGLFLVAPPDLADPGAPEEVRGFRPVDERPVGVPAVLVGSRTDPYSTEERTRRLAAAWGAPYVDAGDAGHVNADSGLGAWADGRRLLDGFVADLLRVRPAR